MLIKEMNRQKNKTICADRHCRDVCQVMRGLREEQGSGAVILSNRKINGGVQQSNKFLSDEQLAYMFGGMVGDANI